MKRLLGAILLRAIQDWQNEKYKADVQMFLESQWFEDLAEALDLNPSTIKKALKADEYHQLNFRSAYR